MFGLAQHTSDRKKSDCYVVTAFFTFWIIVIWESFWPNVIPFTMFGFWTWKGSPTEVFSVSWPLLLWGVSINIVGAFIDDKDRKTERNAEEFLLAGFLISVWAGVMEEICFRWLIFYGEIIGYKLLDFVWCGLLSWIYLYAIGPAANFCTLGYLEPWLFSSLGWAVGAAVISSNGKFRDGHAYQGAFGWINSWFIGVYFFYLMFNHGLLAAMLIHFLYDMFIFVVHYVDAVFGRARNGTTYIH